MTAVIAAPTLNDRQREIVAYIKMYVRMHGFPPSVREIRDAVNVASTSTVHLELVELEEIGVLRRQEKRSRAIALVEAA